MFKMEPITYLMNTRDFYRGQQNPDSWTTEAETIFARDIRLVPHGWDNGTYVKFRIEEHFVATKDIITGNEKRIPVGGEIVVYDYDLKNPDHKILLESLYRGDIRGALAESAAWNIFYSACIKDRRGKKWLDKWLPGFADFYLNFEKEQKDAKKRKP